MLRANTIAPLRPDREGPHAERHRNDLEHFLSRPQHRNRERPAVHHLDDELRRLWLDPIDFGYVALAVVGEADPRVAPRLAVSLDEYPSRLGSAKVELVREPIGAGLQLTYPPATKRRRRLRSASVGNAVHEVRGARAECQFHYSKATSRGLFDRVDPERSHRLVERLQAHFSEYVDRLRDPAAANDELRERFEKRFDAATRAPTGA